MMRGNVTKIGMTGSGKTFSAGCDLIERREEAAVVLDPHKESLAQFVLTHATGNLLFQRLSDVDHALGFSLLTPSRHENPLLRQLENQFRAEAFVEILLRRRNLKGLAGSPLMEEWITAALSLYLNQRRPTPLETLASAFIPESEGFQSLVHGCILPEVAAKFRTLEKLSSRALRAEIGSAVRLLNGTFHSIAFRLRSRGGFDLGAFLQQRGILIVERGEAIGEDAMRCVMGAIVLAVIDHAKRRPRPYPPIRVYIDEATSARLVGTPELRGLAETRKNGLFWEFLVQNLDFPGGADTVLQNTSRHEWFRCSDYELARKGAVDLLAGLPSDDRSRAERIQELTHDIMNLRPGQRWVRDARGSFKNNVSLPSHPYPDWPGLREAKLREKLTWIYARPEYRTAVETRSSNSSPTETPPSSNLPGDSSPAERLKRRGKKRPAGSPKNDDENGSTCEE